MGVRLFLALLGRLVTLQVPLMATGVQQPNCGVAKLGRIDIHRLQIMDAAMWAKARKWLASRS